MNRAVQLARVDAEVGTRALFMLEPPLECDDGSHEYVIVSAIEISDSGPHTFVFAADRDGEILNWSELDELKGVMDIWQGLRSLGYEPIPLVEPVDPSAH